MGLLFLESFGTAETMIIEEIAKDLKVSVEVVAKHYKEMKEAILNEIKN
jgi:hypothetical protein